MEKIKDTYYWKTKFIEIYKKKHIEEASNLLKIIVMLTDYSNIDCHHLVVMLQILLHLDILYPVHLAPCLASKTMKLRLHDLEKLGIRTYWSIGPISSNGGEEYGPRFVHYEFFYNNWWSDKICYQTKSIPL